MRLKLNALWFQDFGLVRYFVKETGNMAQPILEVKHLDTRFFTEHGELRAVDDMSYTVHENECVAIIGESGSGKSVSAMSVLRLIPFPPGLIMGGEILLRGEDLLKMSDTEIRKIRGAKIGMIFQEPMTSLDPVMKIGDQISEALILHLGMDKRDAWNESIELLRKMDIPNPEQRVQEYPHQFSGGMQQRAMIAMAMSCNPDILIADEPTTALDVSVQAQVLEQLNHLRSASNTALIIITHNLGVVARYADSVKIVYGGRIVEHGFPDDIFEYPRHPYTIGLIKAVPRLDLPKSDGMISIDGEPPDMSRIPSNCCAFYSRCKYAEDRCAKERPPEVEISEGHFCACFRHDATEKERQELRC
jgi:oligopeptide/dipeptide ABC transporter ATP-binding protein